MPVPAATRDGDEAIVVDPGTAAPGQPPRTAGPYLNPQPDRDGRYQVEVVIEGWRFEFVVEDEARAALRERATRDRGSATATGGPLEIRAIIPGRIAAVAVTQGDAVEQGQTLLSVEAMKMQNELRSPRAGTVARVPVVAGQTVELGDVLVVLE
jgi:biotin carboxyl carrier protein